MNLKTGIVALLLAGACSRELPTAPTFDQRPPAPVPAAVPAVPARRRAAITYPSVLPPPCSQPAPLYLYPHPIADIYLVLFKPGVDAVQTVATLEAKYGFQTLSTYAAVGGFAARRISADALASLRCEPSVLFIQQDQILTP